jgi:hypothetical protein
VASEEPHITEFMVQTYGALERTLGDLAIGSEGSPSKRWQADTQQPGRLYEQALRQYAEMAAVQAESAAIAHLRLLARAYWPNLANPDPEDQEDWPSEAVFPPARAVLEGLAIVGWLLNPDVEGDERRDRVSRLMVWSTRDWVEVVEKAGAVVPRDKRGKPILLTSKDLIEDRSGSPATRCTRHGARSRTTTRSRPRTCTSGPRSPMAASPSDDSSARTPTWWSSPSWLTQSLLQASARGSTSAAPSMPRPPPATGLAASVGAPLPRTNR